MKAGRLEEASEHLERCREVTAAVGNTFGVGCALFRRGGWRAQKVNASGRSRSSNRRSNCTRRYESRRVVALIVKQVASFQVGSSEAWDRARLFAKQKRWSSNYPTIRQPRRSFLDAHERGVRAAQEEARR